MRGPCYTWQLCTDETERGHLPPCLSKLNFPVANEKDLSCPTNIPDELKPGILEDMIGNFIQRNHESKCYNLSGDLKKSTLTQPPRWDILIFQALKNHQQRVIFPYELNTYKVL